MSQESERLVASWWIGAHSIFGERERLPREDRESIAHSSAQRCLCLLSDTRVMSLSSFLLPASKAKAKAIDKGLDDLFRASASVSLPGGLTSLAERMRIQAPPPYPSGSVATSSSDVAALNLEKKRKATEEVRGGKAKRSKAEAGAYQSSLLSSPGLTGSLAVTPSSSKATPRVPHAQHTDGERSSSEEDEDEVAEESVEEEEVEVEENTGSSDSDDEGDPSKLVHESLLKGAEKKAQSRNGKAKYVPSEETPAQRDARTVFVGNVAIEVVKSRVRFAHSVTFQ